MNQPAMGQREIVIMNALQIIAHTARIDPVFMDRCIKNLKTSETPSGFGALLEQNESEFVAMLEHAKGCRSALEIGSRFGKSIQRIAGVMQSPSRIVSVDMPSGGHGDLPAPEPILRKSIAEIAAAGHDTHLFIGNSRDPQIISGVLALGPFDFCFIDGDHSYEGVKADWENYGPHASIVAFHDIVNNTDCFKLWSEVKTKYRHVEYTDSCWLGIGVLFKDKEA